MKLQASDGIPVVVEESGSGAYGADAVPLVLLHGLSQQRRYWDPVLRRLPNRRVITLDQRGHGEAAIESVTADADFSMDRLVCDVREVLDELALPEAIVVGHSWGASVALHAAARLPDRVRSAVLLDGGLFGPRHLTGPSRDIAEVRESLRPPPLGMLEPVLWQAISTGDLSPYWSREIRDALQPTFTVDEAGRAFTRIGMDRHMAVLDGLIDYDPEPDVDSISCPTWVVSCEPKAADSTDANEDPIASAWAQSRRDRLDGLPRYFFVQRWSGALHDVPLQWPALVAGLLETVVERIEPPAEAMP